MEKGLYFTATLMGLIHQNKDRIEANQLAHEEVGFYIEQYRKLAESHGSIVSIYNHHTELDQRIEKAKSRDPLLAGEIKCKRGCFNCCSMQISISRDEAHLIKQYCREENIKIDIKKLRVQAKKKNTKEWSKLKPHQKRCIFVGEEGECQIYVHRPSACRKYLVLSDPNKCDTKESQEVDNFVDWEVETIASSILNASRSGNFAEMLLEVVQ